MQRVSTPAAKLDRFNGIASETLLAEVNEAAEKLRGLRVIHVNATARGGGVAEILKSLVPLMRDVGIDTEWYTLPPDESFFHISKTLHHCLQGGNCLPDVAGFNSYRAFNEKAVASLKSMGVTADLWFIHDAQVLPMLSYMNSSKGVWICHVDTTESAEGVKEMLFPYMSRYHRIIASMPEYFPNGNNPTQVVVIPPAIDPLQPKHQKMTYPQARQIMAGLGLDTARPIISQVSRFDKWKDPWGVVDAFRLARNEVPGLQLAFLGAMTANDDYDAYEILENLQGYCGDDTDIHIFHNPRQIGDREVNAFQTGSDIVLQKSIREGFGLTVAEAMWKEKPLIGGNCGGIKHQITDGQNGFLVNNASECADRIVTLLKNPALARKMGSAGKESVRNKYLMPRMLRDYLLLASDLMAS
jgi:trehalose synthase